eukprot:237904_1
MPKLSGKKRKHNEMQDDFDELPNTNTNRASKRRKIKPSNTTTYNEVKGSSKSKSWATKSLNISKFIAKKKFQINECEGWIFISTNKIGKIGIFINNKFEKSIDWVNIGCGFVNFTNINHENEIDIPKKK